MGTAVALINNLALLVALSVAAGLLGRYKTPVRNVQLLQGALLGTVAVLGMLNPLVLTPGVQFDGRSVAVSLCGLYFGPAAAAVAGLMAALCRIGLGGSGALTGVLVITASALIGAGFHRVRVRRDAPLSIPRLWGFGMVVHIAMLLLMLTLPGGLARVVLPEIYLTVLLAFPLATVLIGKILEGQEQHLRFVDRLGESEAQFRATLYSIGDGVITTDRQGRVREMNPVAEQLTGWTEAEARGMALESVFRIIDEHERTPAANPARRALEEGIVVGLANHTLLVARDGVERPIADSAAPIRDGGGGVSGVVLVFRDQSAERDAERALRTEETKFRTVFNQQFQFMALLSPEGRVLEINDLPLRATRMRREDVLGRIFWECPWWRDLPAMRAAWPQRLREAAAGDLPILSVDLYQDGDGEVRQAEAALSAIKNEDGTTAYFIVQASDTTDRERARDELLSAKNLLERTLDNLDDVVFAVDAETRRVVQCNRAIQHVFGYTQGEVTGRCTRILHASEESFLTFGRVSEDVLAAGRAFHIEYPMRRKDGALFQAEITVSAIDETLGWRTGVVSVVRDITARKVAEEALRKSEALLRIAGKVARIGGWYVDLPDGVVNWSDEVRAICEAPEGPFPGVGEAIATYLPDSAQRVEAAFDACTRDGTPYDIELELLTGGGRRIWVRTIGQAVRDDAGTIVRVQGALQDITELKQFETSLAQSQQRFHQLADAMPLIVWTADPNGQLDFANRALADFTGNHAAGAPGDRWIEAVHPDDLQRCLDVWQAASAAGTPYTNEFRLRRHDGEYRWHLVQGRPVSGESGSPLKWYGTAADVHDSKLNEERFSQLAARLATTLESITDAFYLLDREWRFTYLNQEAERLLRRPKETLLGRIAGKEFPEIIGSEVDRQYTRAMEENVSVSFEAFYAPLDCWFELHAYPSEEGLAVYFRDITQRVEAERELRAVSARLQGILDFSPLLITEVGLDGRYLLANQATCDLLGVPSGELNGRSLNELLPEASARAFLERIATVAQRKQPLVVEDNFELGGDIRIFSTVLFPLFDPTGAITSVGGIAQEISDRKRAEEERGRLEEQLRQAQKMDAIGRLAGGVAHDFNNMLGVILGYTDMALESLPPDHPVAPDLRQVHTAATHSAELTRQLLAFARKQAIAPEVLNLNDTVASMLRMLRRLIGEDIELLWNPARDLWPARVDPTQIDQILANLAVNARDAISGIGKITIETGNVHFDDTFCETHPGFSPGNFVLLAVSDNGCGMTREIQAQIFEPFFTTKPLGSGTGLGLATVYGIVKQNHGFLNVYSEPGKGSTFKIYLPRHDTTPHTETDPRTRTAARTGTETVLLVEDELALLALGERLLKRLGYQVIPVNGPAQALDAARDFPDTIHLVMTDVIMPGMNGRDLWERLQDLRPGMKSLFMSGYTADVIAHHGALDEGVHFLQKPFTLDALAEKIREAIDG